MADGIQAIEVPIDGHSESKAIAEESSGKSMVEEASDQAQATVEKRIVEPESNLKTNDEKRTDPINASSLVVPERVAARGDSESHKTPDLSASEINTYSEINDNFKKYISRKKRKKTRCYICGRHGHGGHLCKKVTSCFICSEKGHLVVDCPNKNAGEDFTSRLCLKCGNTGHDMFTCANAYDPEDLEDIECYICGKVGHLCCVEDSTKGETYSCYKCGQWGHFGSECIEVPRSFCKKCKIEGHSTKQCPKKILRARAAMKRSQKARRKLNAVISATSNKINSAHQNVRLNAQKKPEVSQIQLPFNQESRASESEMGQTTMVQLPTPDVSHERNFHVPLNHRVQNNLQQPLSRRHQTVRRYAHNRPQIPLMRSEIRVVRHPAPIVNHIQMDSRVPLNYRSLPPYTRNEIRQRVQLQHPPPNVPYYTALPTQFSHAVQNSPQHLVNPQMYANNRPQIPFNQESLTRSEIGRFPMVQHPAPIINHQMDSRVPLNYTAQFSHEVQNPTGSFNPGRYISPETRVPRPRSGWTFGSYY